MSTKKCYQCGHISGRGQRVITILSSLCRETNDRADKVLAIVNKEETK